MTQDFQRHFILNTRIKIVVLLKVSLIIFLDCFSRSLSYRFLLVVIFSRPWTSHAGVFKIRRVSDEYGVLEVKCKRKWFWDLFLITGVHSNSSQLALYVFFALGKIQNWLVGGLFCKLNYNIFFESFCSKPLTSLRTTQWQNDLTEQSRLMMNSLYKNVLWCCYFYDLLCKGSACFDRPEFWMSAICLVRLFCKTNCKILRRNVAKDWAKLEMVKQNLPSYFVCS